MFPQDFPDSSPYFPHILITKNQASIEMPGIHHATLRLARTGLYKQRGEKPALCPNPLLVTRLEVSGQGPPCAARCCEDSHFLCTEVGNTSTNYENENT